MSLKQIMALVPAMGLVLTTAAACKKEGTAEKAGKEIDKAFNTAKDKLNDVTK